MFLCEPCLRHRMVDAKIPPERVMFWAYSHGRCEDCDEIADCDDVPSNSLPFPSKDFRYREVQHV